jgi:O-methyltransferase
LRRRRLTGASQLADDHRLEVNEGDARIIEAARSYTMAGFERQYVLLRAVEYLEKRRIPGAYAECGVWLGGSVLVMLLKLMELGIQDRDVYLYDTFEGMTAPTERDTSAYDRPALEEWDAARALGKRPWPGLFGEDKFALEQVQELLSSTGYPQERVHFVKGRVEETLPAAAPDHLALLRLDTDWYESTRHELVHLYPRLSNAGVILIDDYGHWEGCRRAVDEYFGSGDVTPILLSRVDYSCRIGVKA